MAWQIPTPDGPVSVTGSPGRVTVFLGGNGSGKSSLAFWLSQNAPTPPRPIRVVAHRRLWLKSSGSDTTPAQREQELSLVRSEDRTPASRTRGTWEEKLTSHLLYDLMARETHQNAEALREVRGGKSIQSLEPSILDRINSLFANSGLNLKFSMSQALGFDVTSGDSTYGIDQMSDGEKSAFFLASTLLLAETGAPLLIDEPERHLHRKVSSRFFENLVSLRPDCSFLIFTHDLEMVRSLGGLIEKIVIVDGVEFKIGPIPSQWRIREVSDFTSLPDSAKSAVLGSRSRVLFVEGARDGLDQRLYSILFPGWEILPSGGAKEVARGVAGIRGSSSLHWITAWGVVDGDARHESEVDALREKGVLVLPVNEVENLLFIRPVVEAVSVMKGREFGDDPAQLMERALNRGVAAVSSEQVRRHLSAANSQKILRRRVLAYLPGRGVVPGMGNTVTMSVPSPYRDIYDQISRLVNACDYDAIIAGYSIRDSGLRGAISAALGYRDPNSYQEAVLALLQRDETVLTSVRTVVGHLPLQV
ncbi:ATP-dependent nuclease [Dermacoccus abyssi]|uniref:ATP-dependent nuclease n=1 Tax=Dermacoccus abyssi TaxID=322596 RepID=UPI002AD1F61D|nr:AAA family ATPase [Dermacoccus abyssi]